MADNEALKAQISQVAGLINRQEQGALLPNSKSTSKQEISQLEADGSEHDTSQTHRYSSSFPYARGSSSYSSRGRRGWRGSRGASAPHRNRSLVLNQNSGTQISSNSEGTPQNEQPAAVSDPNLTESGWVRKNDRHCQLINNAVYDQATKSRVKAIEETRKRRMALRDQREMAKVNKYALSQMKATSGSSDKAVQPELEINGIRFRLLAGGSKLVRIKDDGQGARATPKRATVAAVEFIRSKNGNLYRATTVKAKRLRNRATKISEPCKRFQRTGSCIKGPSCPYIHNPDKVAICKDFLQTGKCDAGSLCDLSHDPTPERVPACMHFLKGNCSKTDCRYAHVRVNPAAPVCEAFAVLGFCAKGAECSDRHVHECPAYSNTGTCRNLKCQLPHIDRAGRIRQQTGRDATNVKGPEIGKEDDNASDVISSDEDEYDEIDSDDVDSDGLLDEPVLLTGTPSQGAFGQDDFINL